MSAITRQQGLACCGMACLVGDVRIVFSAIEKTVVCLVSVH